MRGYLRAGAAVLACSGIAALMQRYFEPTNLVMVYLLGVMWVAVTVGRGPAAIAAVLSVAAFDYLFVPPLYTFAIADTQYFVTLAVMLVAALVIGTLAARLRAQLDEARTDERRADALARLSGELVALQDRDRILAAVLRRLETVFDSRAAVLLPDAGGRVSLAAGDPAVLGSHGDERGLAQWAFDAGQPAGLGTHTLPDGRALWVPLHATAGALGVIGLVPADARKLLAPGAFRLLRAFADHAALALERSRLAEQAEGARVQSETERLRSGLLSSVSHDLRTPLAVITGVTSTLLEADGALAPDQRAEMLRTVVDEASRLNQLVGNLLAMTRLESGTLEVRRHWVPVEEIIGAALHRIEPLAGDRAIRVNVASDVPLVAVDDVLIEQVVFNLVENALKHAPASTPIDIRARCGVSDVQVSVADRGPGLPRGAEERVFDKFYRGDAPTRVGGAGLGLAICRGIVEAHGGTIRAAERVGGGAEFTFALPLGADSPSVEAEPAAGMP